MKFITHKSVNLKYGTNLNFKDALSIVPPNGREASGALLYKEIRKEVVWKKLRIKGLKCRESSERNLV